MKAIQIIFLLLTAFFSFGQKRNQSKQPDLTAQIEVLAKAQEAQVIKWRRHMHQYPELSNREYKTMAYIAENLKDMDITIETIGTKTGIVVTPTVITTIPVTQPNRCTIRTQ